MLVKELQSLCLDVRVLDENGMKIDLKGDDSEDLNEIVRDDSYYKGSEESFTAHGFSVHDIEDGEDVEVEEEDSEEDELDSELGEILGDIEGIANFEDLDEEEKEKEDSE